MRYSADHKAQTRDKLLCSSSAIAKRGGFAATGVDGLMKAIGLSGGAFYSHFPSKNDLFSAIVERELSQSLARLADSGHAQPVRQILELPLKQCPEVLLLGMATVKSGWGPLQQVRGWQQGRGRAVAG